MNNAPSLMVLNRIAFGNPYAAGRQIVGTTFDSTANNSIRDMCARGANFGDPAKNPRWSGIAAFEAIGMFITDLNQKQRIVAGRFEKLSVGDDRGADMLQWVVLTPEEASKVGNVLPLLWNQLQPYAKVRDELNNPLQLASAPENVGKLRDLMQTRAVTYFSGETGLAIVRDLLNAWLAQRESVVLTGFKDNKMTSRLDFFAALMFFVPPPMRAWLTFVSRYVESVGTTAFFKCIDVDVQLTPHDQRVYDIGSGRFLLGSGDDMHPYVQYMLDRLGGQQVESFSEFAQELDRWNEVASRLIIRHQDASTTLNAMMRHIHLENTFDQDRHKFLCDALTLLEKDEILTFEERMVYLERLAVILIHLASGSTSLVNALTLTAGCNALQRFSALVTPTYQPAVRSLFEKATNLQLTGPIENVLPLYLVAICNQRACQTIDLVRSEALMQEFLARSDTLFDPIHQDFLWKQAEQSRKRALGLQHRETVIRAALRFLSVEGLNQLKLEFPSLIMPQDFPLARFVTLPDKGYLVQPIMSLISEDSDRMKLALYAYQHQLGGIASDTAFVEYLLRRLWSSDSTAVTDATPFYTLRVFPTEVISYSAFLLIGWLTDSVINLGPQHRQTKVPPFSSPQDSLPQAIGAATLWLLLEWALWQTAFGSIDTIRRTYSDRARALIALLGPEKDPSAFAHNVIELDLRWQDKRLTPASLIYAHLNIKLVTLPKRQMITYILLKEIKNWYRLERPLREFYASLNATERSITNEALDTEGQTSGLIQFLRQAEGAWDTEREAMVTWLMGRVGGWLSDIITEHADHLNFDTILKEPRNFMNWVFERITKPPFPVLLVRQHFDDICNELDVKTLRRLVAALIRVQERTPALSIAASVAAQRLAINSLLPKGSSTHLREEMRLAADLLKRLADIDQYEGISENNIQLLRQALQQEHSYTTQTPADDFADDLLDVMDSVRILAENFNKKETSLVRSGDAARDNLLTKSDKHSPKSAGGLVYWLAGILRPPASPPDNKRRRS